MRTRISALVFVSVCSTLQLNASEKVVRTMDSYDMDFIDRYLKTFDEVQNHNSENQVYLTTAKSSFERQMGLALSKKDKRAPGRLTYLAMLNGGPLKAEDKIGLGLSALAGNDLKATSMGAKKVYRPSDIYIWFTANSEKYDACPQLDDWLKSQSGKAMLTVLNRLKKLAEDKAGPNASDARMAFIDEYLKTWDDFAQGANEKAALIREERDSFECELAEALTQKDKRAPARLVFSSVVTVGMPVELEGALGAAFKELVGEAVPKTTFEGRDCYFSADLYFWWQENKAKYEASPLFDEWSKREFAQKSVIPMFEKLRTKK